METIKEDYVSFELAKLLKEKGFFIPSFHYEDWMFCMYDENGNLHWGCYDSNWYARITLSMAVKWIRTKHNLSIEVYRTACGYVGCIVAIPSGTDIKFIDWDGDDRSSGQYTKWEYACEATIKDCLENLETLTRV
jgi:hypothetical protein